MGGGGLRICRQAKRALRTKSDIGAYSMHVLLLPGPSHHVRRESAIRFGFSFAARLAFKEERLTDDRLQSVGAKWFGNQEGRLGRRPSQEPFRVVGNDNDRHREMAEDLIYCIETRTAVSELYIGENKTRPCTLGGFDGFAMGACDRNDSVSKLLHQSLQGDRNPWLIL